MSITQTRSPAGSPTIQQFQGENPMNKGALALLVHGGTENWSPERWKSRFDEVCRGRRVLLLPDTAFDPAEIHFAAVWKPAPGELAAFPNLRVIFNLGAGVDALMADSTLPKVPLVRVAVGDLTDRMTEYVVLHVLMHHRQEPCLRASQRARRWAPRFQWPASAVSVGIIGGAPVLDLNYEEDSKAGVDMNVVATEKGRFIELQGTAEGATFSEEEMQAMMALAKSGIAQLVAKQREILSPLLTRVDGVARERLNRKFR